MRADQRDTPPNGVRDGVPGARSRAPRRPPWTPSRVLVTGAAGLIGREVAVQLRRRGVQVTALVLDDPGGLAADRVVVGDAGSPEAVRDALAGVDAVVHLAAMASPLHGTAREVFLGNTGATFTVLDEAARAGVRRAVVASSLSILGLPWAARPLHPAYLPVDEQVPLQIEDPYGLSKAVDEQIARALARMHGMAVVALRYPFVTDAAREEQRLAALTADPASGAADLWAYLDVRDAAAAAWQALSRPLSGFHRVFVAAPDTLAPYRTQDLIERYHPDSELRRPLPGREVPIDLGRARRLLGFTARHLCELGPNPRLLPSA